MYNGPHRKNMRLREYNYSDDGFYFVTFCTKNRENYLGEIIDGKMILNDYGKIAEKFCNDIPKHFPKGNIDYFVIMPNHIHAIIIINNKEHDVTKNTKHQIVGNADLRSLQENNDSIDRTKMEVSKIVHGFKSSLTREIRKQYNDYNFSWQKSYYDKIIRNEDELNKTRQYIIDNPINREFDKNNI